MDRKELEKLAELARIDLPDGELQGLQKDMEAILNYVSQIQEVSESVDDVSGGGLLRNVMREDGKPHKSGIYTEELLSAVPQREGEYVKVKKIL